VEELHKDKLHQLDHLNKLLLRLKKKKLKHQKLKKKKLTSVQVDFSVMTIFDKKYI
jgi:hypothetical protein